MSARARRSPSLRAPAGRTLHKVKETRTHAHPRKSRAARLRRCNRGRRASPLASSGAIAFSRSPESQPRAPRDHERMARAQRGRKRCVRGHEAREILARLERRYDEEIRAVRKTVLREHRRDLRARPRPIVRIDAERNRADLLARDAEALSDFARDEIGVGQHEIRALERFRQMSVEKAHALDRMRLGKAEPRKIVYGRQRRTVEWHQHISLACAESIP